MATQHGIECWCATEVDMEVDYDRHGVEGAQCDLPCPGNQVRNLGSAEYQRAST